MTPHLAVEDIKEGVEASRDVPPPIKSIEREILVQSTLWGDGKDAFILPSSSSMYTIKPLQSSLY